jgi:hypothetical protein
MAPGMPAPRCTYLGQLRLNLGYRRNDLLVPFWRVMRGDINTQRELTTGGEKNLVRNYLLSYSSTCHQNSQRPSSLYL